MASKTRAIKRSSMVKGKKNISREGRPLRKGINVSRPTVERQGVVTLKYTLPTRIVDTLNPPKVKTFTTFVPLGDPNKMMEVALKKLNKEVLAATLYRDNKAIATVGVGVK